MKKYRRPGRVKPAPYVPWAGVQKLIAPAQVSRKTEPIPEPIPAVDLVLEPAPPPASEPDPTANRFHLEVWLNQHRPDLLAVIRAAEQEVSRMYWYSLAGFPEKLAAAEAALARAVAAGQQAMREALEAGREPAQKLETEVVLAGQKEAEPGPEVQEPERELAFEEIEQLFGGFIRVWELTSAQAAKLEKVFQEKGPIAVRSENGRWWSAEEWYAACQN